MRTRLLTAVVGVSAIMGCGNHEGSSPEGAVGSLRAAVDLSESQNGVTAVRFDILMPEEDCAGSPLVSKVVSLEEEALPSSLADSGTHAFADGLFVLEEGAYRVCVTPLSGETPSAVCSRAEAMAEVWSGETTEVMLVSQCLNPSHGGLDVVLSLNDAPAITQLELAPSKFISVCESLTATVTASDPNEDDLTYSWSIVEGPESASLQSSGATATFAGPAGDYGLRVDVIDGHGGSAKLEFPVYVTDAVCSVPDAVQEIFTQRCSPCHTSRSSAGLSLADASTSYANLVNVGSSAASCADRTRVVPGASELSYLLAKLRGASDICGSPMPRNLPALPEVEIETIESWIESLPQ